MVVETLPQLLLQMFLWWLLVSEGFLVLGVNREFLSIQLFLPTEGQKSVEDTLETFNISNYK